MNLSPELEKLACMPPISFRNRRLVLENLIAPIELDRLVVAQEYLRQQGWIETAMSEGEVTYSRGSRAGNMFSFHADKLMSAAVLKTSNSAIVLSLNIDTSHQIVTVWNYLSLQTEMEDFGESVLMGEVTHRWQELFVKECGVRLYFDWTPARLRWKQEALDSF